MSRPTLIGVLSALGTVIFLGILALIYNEIRKFRERRAGIVNESDQERDAQGIRRVRGIHLGHPDPRALTENTATPKYAGQALTAPDEDAQRSSGQRDVDEGPASIARRGREAQEFYAPRFEAEMKEFYTPAEQEISQSGPSGSSVARFS